MYEFLCYNYKSEKKSIGKKSISNIFKLKKIRGDHYT